MIAVVVVWTVAFFISNMLQCIPLSLNWTGLGGNNYQCIDKNMMYLGQAFSDVITDGEYLAGSFDAVLRLDSYDPLDAAALRKLYTSTMLEIAADGSTVLGPSNVDEAQGRCLWRFPFGSTVSPTRARTSANIV